ncbi:MAG: GHKL domain-containing protein, partial [Nitrosopumilus sp.]|nr:GHKL domain-containing protein [Nitrosopumilus sp.]
LNAVQAIDNDTNGSITIKLEEKTSNVKIEFENSGPPIPNDKLPHIFKPLFTTKLKGTGLGLSGCKNIIEQHKGKISATSNPVVFTITLPKKIDDKSIERLD